MAVPRTALVGVGSNAAPATHVAAGLAALRAHFGALTCSTIYESPPRSGTGAAYWNLAVALRTDATWDTVRATLKTIEQACGRRRDEQAAGVVTLDLDLLVLEGVAGEADAHDLPWPAVGAEAHVIVPLAEIAPAWRHPEAGRCLADLARDLLATGPALTPVTSSLVEHQSDLEHSA